MNNGIDCLNNHEYCFIAEYKVCRKITVLGNMGRVVKVGWRSDFGKPYILCQKNYRWQYQGFKENLKHENNNQIGFWEDNFGWMDQCFPNF